MSELGLQPRAVVAAATAGGRKAVSGRLTLILTLTLTLALPLKPYSFLAIMSRSCSRVLPSPCSMHSPYPARDELCRKQAMGNVCRTPQSMCPQSSTARRLHYPCCDSHPSLRLNRAPS